MGLPVRSEMSPAADKAQGCVSHVSGEEGEPLPEYIPSLCIIINKGVSLPPPELMCKLETVNSSHTHTQCNYDSF